MVFSKEQYKECYEKNEEEKIKSWIREYYDELEVMGEINDKRTKEEIINEAYEEYKRCFK
ncbi:MAG: hypothetical protein I3273_05025 [Candidatus Moeniiplasma glomeromycotorum]|nr:hypothetical protein [Candidatus Moeniiplasma glomeromycotorum]MCE8167905.1 hypothetical protein [Candidatus Moeniiplasma glomeromycotorum]MCE8169455.1 hypothetical protein [Candidatus Moeniiplasma glomeromycotorum]